MKKTKLLIHGGKKAITKKFARYNSIGKEELIAASKVIKTGVLSDFVGANTDAFYGGKYVKKFERRCEKFFNVKYAVSVNSWTSGLIASVGAIDIEPGDEIILSPWTMSACAMSILHWNAIPVFADIEDKTFNLDPKSVIKNITSKTKAIMSVDIFGHPHNFDEIKKIAKKYNLKIITDTAQAPYTFFKNKFAGTLGDVGGFSLNYHKHIHTGEGGVVVTNNRKIYQKLLLIRNHGESVIQTKNKKNLVNIIGYNFRLGEIESAIGIEQLKKLKKKVIRRQKIAKILDKGLSKLNGLGTPIVKKGYTHAYYVYPMVLNEKIVKVKREKIINALKKEGLNGIMGGYQNLHLLPIFQKKIAYGSKGFPWKQNRKISRINYSRGICPVAEELHSKTFIGFTMCLYELSNNEVNSIVNVFEKVWHNLDKI
tara:strand:+ start:730 stop:2007 length:1278 start_codon:yes stop_codon:yes gene_type:complete